MINTMRWQRSQSQSQIQMDAPLKQRDLVVDGFVRHAFVGGGSLHRPIVALCGRFYGWKRKGKGITDLVMDAVHSSEKRLWSEMYRNVLLSGGSTMFPGIKQRLEKELRGNALNVEMEVKVIAQSQTDRKYNVWLADLCCLRSARTVRWGRGYQF